MPSPWTQRLDDNGTQTRQTVDQTLNDRVAADRVSAGIAQANHGHPSWSHAVAYGPCTRTDYGQDDGSYDVDGNR
jgi:hypothetical protein